MTKCPKSYDISIIENGDKIKKLLKVTRNNFINIKEFISINKLDVLKFNIINENYIEETITITKDELLFLMNVFPLLFQSDEMDEFYDYSGNVLEFIYDKFNLVNQIVSCCVSSNNYNKYDLLDNIATLIKIVDLKSISNNEDDKQFEITYQIDVDSDFL
jgi:hypothetical protein